MASRVCSRSAPGREINGEIGGRGVGQIVEQGAPVEDDVAGLVTVVVEDIDDAEFDSAALRAGG